MNELNKIDLVMVVDDNQIDSFIAKEIICTSKFSEQVIIKKSCDEAIEYLKNENNILPDIIFLDLFMPGQTGYDFIKYVEKHPELLKNKSKIIILSVLIDNTEIEKLTTNSLVHKFYHKPLSVDLLRTI